MLPSRGVLPPVPRGVTPPGRFTLLFLDAAHSCAARLQSVAALFPPLRGVARLLMGCCCPGVAQAGVARVEDEGGGMAPG